MFTPRETGNKYLTNVDKRNNYLSPSILFYLNTFNTFI